MTEFEGELRQPEAGSRRDLPEADINRRSGYADTPPGGQSGGAFQGTSDATTNAQSMGSSTTDKAKDALGSAQEQADRVIDTATTKAAEIGDQATQKADIGKEKAASGLTTLAETLRDRSQSMGEGQLQSAAATAANKLESGAEMLRQKDTDELIADLEALVRRRPVESMIVAAAAGFFFSKALR
jgi:ElaB/YqjD/DUF883 family membrane-anchored ribosome-binding protein